MKIQAAVVYWLLVIVGLVSPASPQSVFPANGCPLERPYARLLRGEIEGCQTLPLGELVCNQEICWRLSEKKIRCFLATDNKICLTYEELRKAGGE